MAKTKNTSTSRKSSAKSKVKISNPVLVKKGGKYDHDAIKYRALVEHMNEAVWVGDENEITVYANPKFCEMMGFSMDEMLGRPSYDFWTKESAKRVRNVNEGERSLGISSSYEGELLTKSGKEIPVLLSGTPLPSGGTIGIMTDLRDIRHKEKEVQTLLQKLDVATTASKDGLWYAEVPFSNVGDFNFLIDQCVWYSPRVSEMLGYSPEELPCTIQEWVNLVHPDDAQRVISSYRSDVKSKSSFEVAYRLRLKNASYKWFSTRGDIIISKENKTVLFAGSIRDIHRRKVAEAALVSSKKLFDDLVEGSPVATFVINTENKIVYWNRALEELTGLKAKDMIGTKDHWKPFYKKKKDMISDMMIHGFNHKQILKHYEHMDVEESSDKDGIVGSVYFTNIKGQKRWLRFMIKPMRDADHKVVGVVETVEDITERKRTAEALASRTREFQTLYQVHSHTLMANPLSKVLSDVTNDILTACRESSCARSRITFDDKVYTNLKKSEEFVRPLIVEPIKINGKKRGKVELGYIQKIDHDKDPLLTEEKRLLHMVANTLGRHVRSREVIERHKKLVNKSTVGIYIVQDDVFQYVNPKFNKIFKFKSTEAQGRFFGDLVLDCQCYSRLAETNKKSVKCEVKGRRKDGSIIDIEIVTQGIDYHGRPAFLGTVQDVTKLKQAQEKLKNFNLELKDTIAEKTRDLKKANRRLQSLNELKDEFIAVTSHELRSPLTAIRGYLSFLVEESLFKDVPEEAKDYLLRAYDNVEVLNNLMNNILDVSRLDTNNLELYRTPTDLIYLIQGVIRNLSYQAKEKQLQFEFQNLTDESNLILHLDSVRIQQVLRNILENAVKYSHRKKSIQVVVERKGIGVEISLIDHGVGIPKSQVFNIFDKFKQAKNSHARYKGGAGLGLFIAKKIVELHGGMIWAESELRKGTTFRIQLPIL